MITFINLNDLQLHAICLLISKFVAIVALFLKALILGSIRSGRHILSITLGTSIFLLDILFLVGSCIIRKLSLLIPTALGSHYKNTLVPSFLHILLFLSEDCNHLLNGPLLLLSIITRPNTVKLRSPHDQPNNII